MAIFMPSPHNPRARPSGAEKLRLSHSILSILFSVTTHRDSYALDYRELAIRIERKASSEQAITS